ncbi:hypothetical protein [Ruegeria arenilitoris]|uniref:hypothetical protein n=1 Tax=Ruegeria arenilitoris TaxID=1173585 RepID=UPI00147F33AF|nr:hypothetical protein [Ruegeria arenilitoris]
MSNSKGSSLLQYEEIRFTLKGHAPMRVLEKKEEPELDDILAATVDEDDAEGPRWELEELELNRLPQETVEVARTDYLVNHSPGLTWEIEWSWHVVDLSDEKGTFALLQLYWDDNWERWDWSLEAAVTNCSGKGEARAVLIDLVAKTHLSYGVEEAEAYLKSLLPSHD